MLETINKYLTQFVSWMQTMIDVLTSAIDAAKVIADFIAEQKQKNLVFPDITKLTNVNGPYQSGLSVG